MISLLHIGTKEYTPFRCNTLNVTENCMYEFIVERQLYALKYFRYFFKQKIVFGFM